MGEVDELIRTIEEKGGALEFFGPQAAERIHQLEKALTVRLPPSYVTFLERFGGGGTLGSGISGIYNDQPLTLNDGTVYGDTLRTREDFALPRHLVVIYRDESDAVWCLDTSTCDENGECPVVAYDVGRRRVAERIASSFAKFFEDYLRVRAQD